ncbi:MAG: aminoglycoside phosphotransferase family protein [Oscillospiraceae bacterium]|nr:aminoglycoside phosphotransferase family protein [Oscillospiraceae bacterium]
MDGCFIQVLNNFDLGATPISCDRYGCGHINETYLVVTQEGKRYILQKINNTIFKNTDGLMGNIEAVTTYLRQQTDDERRVMRLVKTRAGKSYLTQPDGSCWRVYVFVEDSVCLQKPETPADFYESAVAFGQFQQMLQDFPADTLYEIIPNFHNTRDRYRIFREVLQKDPMGRAKDVQPEIEFALAREKEAATLVELLEAGKLPLRVTHNDTKLNNVMLDAETRTALCVIDLDTVMPGLSLYDFGDSIRFGAATGDEDERQLDKIEMSLELFETYTKGFLSACPGLTEMEIQMLPMGAKLMTLECGVRFLTDYLDGDHYFANRREGQNLDRCRTQFKLVADMENKWEQMHAIVQKAAQG